MRNLKSHLVIFFTLDGKIKHIYFSTGTNDSIAIVPIHAIARERAIRVCALGIGAAIVARAFARAFIVIWLHQRNSIKKCSSALECYLPPFYGGTFFSFF